MYGSNNPISRIDPMGTQDMPFHGGDYGSTPEEREAFARGSAEPLRRFGVGVVKGAEGLRDTAVGLGHGLKQLVTAPGQHLEDLTTVATNAPGAVVDGIAQKYLEIQRDPLTVFELTGEVGFNFFVGAAGSKGLDKLGRFVKGRSVPLIADDVGAFERLSPGPGAAAAGDSAFGAALEPFQVGRFNVLRDASSVGDDLALHHVGQKHVMKQIVPGYDPATAPAIAVPTAQHQAIPNLRGAVSSNPRQILARDIRNLRRYTDAPNESLEALIEMNKALYKEAFKK